MMKSITPVSIADWHDGLVLGAIRCSWLVEVHLAGLVAWDIDHALRALVVVPADSGILRVLSTEPLERVQAAAEEHMRQQSVALVFTVADFDGTLCGEPITVSVAELFGNASAGSFFDAREALSPHRQKWLRGGPNRD